MKPMRKRERIVLKDIKGWRGGYSIHWTPKTRAKLEERGYVVVVGDKVKITDAGMAAINTGSAP